MSSIIGEKYNTITGDESYDIVKRLTSRTYTITYFVQGSPTTGSSTIYNTPGLPQIGSYPVVNGVTQTGCRCISRSLAEVDSDKSVWAVECKFDSNYTPDDDVYPVWSWGFETQDVVIQYTPNYNLPICNTMGQPIVVTSPQPIPILTIERYEANFDSNVILNYVNRINSTPFWGSPPWTALMAGISDEQALLNGQKVRKVTYTIKFKIDEFGWRLVLLNEGGKCRKLVSSEPKNAQSEWSRAAVHTIKDQDGNPTTGVLDWYGYLLGAGPQSSAQPPDFVPVTSEMVPTIYNGGYLVFDQFPVTNLNALQLGPWIIPRN